MKISIVVPIYNSEIYLKKCLDSLINQIYKNIEIICVNDGSTDNSYRILNEYKKIDSRIKIINQENQGANIARKNGIKESTGQYVMFVDSDDYIKEDTIAKLVDIIKREKVDLIKFKFINFINFDLKEGIYTDKNELYKQLLTSSKLNNITTEIISKNIINLDDEVFNVKTSSGEDLLMNLSIYDRANKIKIIKNQYYYYRNNNNSTTHLTDTKKLLLLIKESNINLNFLLLYSKKWNLHNKDILDFIYYRIIKSVYDRIGVIIKNDFNNETIIMITNLLNELEISKINGEKIIKKYEKNILNRLIYNKIHKRKISKKLLVYLNLKYLIKNIYRLIKI